MIYKVVRMMAPLRRFGVAGSCSDDEFIAGRIRTKRLEDYNNTANCKCYNNY